MIREGIGDSHSWSAGYQASTVGEYSKLNAGQIPPWPEHFRENVMPGRKAEGEKMT